MRSSEILRVARDETSETKYEGLRRFVLVEDSLAISQKKNFACPSLHRKCTMSSTGFPHAFALRAAACRHLTRSSRPTTLNFSMHSKKRTHLVAALVWMLACAATAFAESSTLFRVFLNDGTAVVSYGEYARVGDRARVLDAARRRGCRQGRSRPSRRQSAGLGRQLDRHHASTPTQRGFRTTWRPAPSPITLRWPDEVAAALNAIVLAKDPKARLNMAVEARRRLASWPRDHYGYRADDVREMLGLLDEAISGLRAAAGETSFVLDSGRRRAGRRRRAKMSPLLRAPTAAESIAQAIAVAKATDIAADRVSILRGVLATLDKARNATCRRAGRRRRASGRFTPSEKKRGSRRSMRR